MAQPTSTVEFSCSCGMKIRARLDQGGKVYPCTSCGAKVTVPTIALPTEQPTLPPQNLRSHLRAGSDVVRGALTSFEVPSTFNQLFKYMIVTGGALTILATIVFLFSKIVGTLFFLIIMAVSGHQFWLMLRARQRVLTTKNVPLLWSFVRLIAWDPIEGVLILRNKTVAFCDDNLEDAAGGVRLLYSIFGEELAIRAPLEVQTLSFRDENVLTREYLSVTIRGTMKWRIVDLKKFYLLVSRERRSTTNHNDHESISASTRAVVSADEGAEPAIRQLLRAAIGWMQVLVEEETRTVVSRAKTGLLIADKLSQDLSPRLYDRPPASTDGPATSDSAAPAWGGAAEGLAGAIHATIAMRLEPYGIAVEDVSLQEIKLPEEVMQECIAAAKSYYFPTIAKRKAAFGYEKLKAQADVIGADAVGTREVVGAAPAFTLPDFLSQYLQKRMPAAHGQDTQTVDGALITGAIATIAANSSAQLPRRSDGEKT